MTEDKQAVVEQTDASPKADVKVDSAPDKGGDDLDVLLKEFEQGQDQPPRPTPTPKAEVDTDLKVQGEQIRALSNIQFRRDMNETIGKVRGELDVTYFDDEFVQAWIDAKAQTDPRLQRAWVDRHNNPAGFRRVVDGLGKDFAKKYGKLPDQSATQDRETVAAAMRGASTRAPEDKPPNFSGKSNNEFADDVEKNYGYRPAV